MTFSLPFTIALTYSALTPSSDSGAHSNRSNAIFPKKETRWEVRHCLFKGLWSSAGSTEEGFGRDVSLNRLRKTATKAGDSRCVKCGCRLIVSFFILAGQHALTIGYG